MVDYIKCQRVLGVFPSKIWQDLVRGCIRSDYKVTPRNKSSLLSNSDEFYAELTMFPLQLQQLPYLFCLPCIIKEWRNLVSIFLTIHKQSRKYLGSCVSPKSSRNVLGKHSFLLIAAFFSFLVTVLEIHKKDKGILR